MTAEWDVMHALDRLDETKSNRPVKFQRYDHKLDNDYYYRENPNLKGGFGAGRRLEDLDYYKSLPDEELVIDYMPVKYEVTFEPT